MMTQTAAESGTQTAHGQQAIWKQRIDTSAVDWASFDDELNRPFELTPAQIDSFRKQGFVKVKQVLSPELVKAFGDEITNEVIRLNTEDRPIDQRSTYGKAFLQIMNLWRHSPIVHKLVASKRLAKLAADLLGVDGVRLYHDQALYKEPGGGVTPWHADQFYWPVSTNNTVTVWIPLQETPKPLGPLAFSATSHRSKIGRDLEISDESEMKISKSLLESGLPLVEEPFDVGEVSFHYGWTFHRAAANQSDRPRKVMTIIYLEDGCRVIQPQYKAHENDIQSWMPGLKAGDVVNTELNPVLWRK